MEVDMKWRSTMKNKNLCKNFIYGIKISAFKIGTRSWFYRTLTSLVPPMLPAFYWSIRGHSLRKKWIYICGSSKHQNSFEYKDSVRETGLPTKTSGSRYFWRWSLSWTRLKHWRCVSEDEPLTTIKNHFLPISTSITNFQSTYRMQVLQCC